VKALDFRELDGFQFDKDRALADWRHRKEQAEFGVLVNRLRARKWQREVYAEGGNRLERLRAVKRKHAARPAVKLAGLENAKARRARAYRENPIVCTCVECGSTWCPLPRRGVRPLEFCTDACRQRYRYHERKPAARRNRRPA
jgi:hypothetical protein